MSPYIHTGEWKPNASRHAVRTYVHWIAGLLELDMNQLQNEDVIALAEVSPRLTAAEDLRSSLDTIFQFRKAVRSQSDPGKPASQTKR